MGSASERAVAEPQPLGRRFTLGRGVVVVAGLALIGAQAIPYVAGELIDQSQKAVARGDLTTAAERVSSARATQPWASSPYVQLALVRERERRFGEASASISQALARGGDDWRTWLISARIADERGMAAAARSDAARARSLNPQSPIWDTPWSRALLR